MRSLDYARHDSKWWGLFLSVISTKRSAWRNLLRSFNSDNATAQDDRQNVYSKKITQKTQPITAVFFIFFNLLF